MSGNKNLTDLKALYPKLNINPSGSSATLELIKETELRLDDDVSPKEWKYVNLKTGSLELASSLIGDAKFILNKVVCDYTDIKNENEESKKAQDNLKESGFELEVKPEASEEWKATKEAEDKKAEEEKAKLEREANLRKLAMAEEAELEEAKKEQVSAQTSKKQSDDQVIFTDRPVEYVDAPAPKTGEVNLYDVLNKICKHDLMQVFGNTGTGKTSLCTKLALDSRAKGKSVLYIDTEGSINDDQIDAMKKTGTKYEFIKQFQKLCETVKRLPKVNVLIVDSAGVPALAAYCKSNLGGQGDILKKFIAMSDDLKTYASDNNALVVVVNQPESSMSKGENAILEPFGEKSRYYYKEILKTNYAKRGRTTAKTTLVLSAHRSRCMGIDTPVCTMEVTNDGVKVIQ